LLFADIGAATSGAPAVLGEPNQRTPVVFWFPARPVGDPFRSPADIYAAIRFVHPYNKFYTYGNYIRASNQMEI
jgi:hypothetical protein